MQGLRGPSQQPMSMEETLNDYIFTIFSIIVVDNKP